MNFLLNFKLPGTEFSICDPDQGGQIFEEGVNVGPRLLARLCTRLLVRSMMLSLCQCAAADGVS